MIGLCIICGLVFYIWIGFFINGFFGNSIDKDSSLFYATTVLWPCFILAFVLIVVCRFPIRCGKKLGDKYRDMVETKINKLFE